MADPATGAVAGRTFGPYRVLSALGEGGMGTVYKARDEKLDRVVALKFIRADLNERQSIQQRFLLEARSASALDHPNIGTIYGIEESPEGHLFIVMAYYEGENLAHRIHRGSLPPAEAVDIAIQIAKGLAEAHAHKIVHRDIKSSNVILTSSGLVKIVDFGLARIIHSTSATLTAGLSGTAAYMPPEQATGRPMDHRADLWALGVVFWEMLTGQLPFQADSVPALLLNIANNPPAALPQDFQDSLRPILYRALAKQPDIRYQTAEEMVADLERCRPTQATLPTRSMPARELRRIIKSASGVSPSNGGRPWAAATIIACIASLLAVSLFVLRSNRLPSASKHLAILPLEIGDDPSNQALADGLQEGLTNRLSNLESGSNALWVVSADVLRRRKITDPTAAQQLGVNLVVTGSVRRDAAGLQLALHLIDPANLHQLNGDVLVDRAGDLAGLQDRAVAKLAAWMKIPVTLRTPEGVGSTGPAAYESYLKARGYMQRYDKPGNIDLAIAQYQGAVKADPRFAIGWAGMGDAYLSKYHVDQNPAWIEKATETATRAMQIDNALAPVHITLGRIQSDSGKLDLAVQEFQRALDLDPRSSDALLGMGNVYERQGRLTEAATTYERGAALRPDYWEGYNRLGDFYNRQKRYADAEAQFRIALKLSPDNWVPYLNLGAALQQQNRFDESARALERSIQLNPSYPGYANLGNIYYRQIKPEQAAPLFEKALALNDKDFRVWFNFALANRWLAMRGDKAAADKARSGYKRALDLLLAKAAREPNDEDAQERIAIIDAFLGEREEALRHLESARLLEQKQDSFEFVKAQVMEMLGDRKQAIAALGTALQKGMQYDIAKRNPEVQSVLADPNFKYKH